MKHNIQAIKNNQNEQNETLKSLNSYITDDREKFLNVVFSF